MHFVIHPGDELPIYRQIMRQIREAVVAGRIKTGEKLPSHRELAEQLVIAPLTVKKAYDELEQLGFLETQRGRGTFVCDKLPRFRVEEQRAAMEAAARQLLSLAHLVGLRFDEVVAMLKRVELQLAPDTHGVESSVQGMRGKS